MNLLILGAGGHGRVVAEIAQDCGYDHISFLDDNSPDAIGRIDELERFANQFDNAFAGIGNNVLREQLILRLEAAGYHVPVLIHPSAYVSRTAKIGKGTVVEPKAIVNAGTVVGLGCIISVGAIVDHNVVVGKCSHINAGSIVKAGAEIKERTKLEAGQVVLGYEHAVVRIPAASATR